MVALENTGLNANRNVGTRLPAVQRLVRAVSVMFGSGAIRPRQPHQLDERLRRDAGLDELELERRRLSRAPLIK